MANIEITCRNFAGAHAGLNGTHNRDVSRRAIFRAVITVGFQRYKDLFRPGWRNFFHRFGIGLSAFSLLEQRSKNLCLSPAYSKLDMSEKGTSSYWFGMAFAKLVAEIELSVPWIVHVDQLRASGVLTTISETKERGDLVGIDDKNNWHVVEAKGRSNPYPQSLVSKAKRQASRVAIINGQTPATTSACIASLFTQPISVLLDDPPLIAEENQEQWRIRDEDFFKHYYRSIIEYLSEFGAGKEQKIGDTVFLTAPLFPFYWDFFHFIPPPRFSEWRLELGLLAKIGRAHV